MVRSYFFGFEGRLNRARYWLFAAIAIPAVVAMGLAYYMYAVSIPAAYENGGPTPMPSGPAGVAVMVVMAGALLALCIAGIAITVKRLHDRDKSWWWIFVFLIVPNFGYGLGQYGVQTQAGPAAMAAFGLECLAFVLAAWGFVELGCLRGSVGDNRYGPDPLAAKR